MTYNELEVAKTTSLDSLLEGMRRAATPEEKLRLDDLLKKMRKTTRKKPLECAVELDGKEYEVLIRPKG